MNWYPADNSKVGVADWADAEVASAKMATVEIAAALGGDLR